MPTLCCLWKVLCFQWCRALALVLMFPSNKVLYDFNADPRWTNQSFALDDFIRECIFTLQGCCCYFSEVVFLIYKYIYSCYETEALRRQNFVFCVQHCPLLARDRTSPYSHILTRWMSTNECSDWEILRSSALKAGVWLHNMHLLFKIRQNRGWLQRKDVT